MIGRGSYGSCWKVKRKSDQMVLACKKVKLEEERMEYLIREVLIIREVKHPHIVRSFGHILDKVNKTLYLMMEFCEMGDLDIYIEKKRKEGKTVPEKFVWKVFSQLVSALKACHTGCFGGRPIIHRDLKPANIFLDQKNNVKIGDFGFARVLERDSYTQSFLGSPIYLPPEIVKQQPYNEKVDVWSLGIVIYELCALIPPFRADKVEHLGPVVVKGIFEPLSKPYSDDLNEIIKCMLRVDPVRRPSMVDISNYPRLLDANNNAQNEFH